MSCCHFCETFKGTDYAAKNQDHPLQIPMKLPPKSFAHNGCGIVRHSTLWLKPEAVAQIDFLEWTGGDHLRHTKFVALREDKDPKKVVRET
ncbi:hypothetical protein [Edaphobacter aggregans]|uniref:ATP dependent DNA ligase n=1 Tax=Edaphobacter aggregans TaxID=570835 RepID=UPI00247FB4DB|nr:hypothetical protein [Edaphobacter aggregans]